MVAGVGLDIIDASRFERASERTLRRLFTDAERRYAAGRPRPTLHLAARFAAKEAVLKALGTGWSGGIAWTDVEVVRKPDGQVSVRLSGRAAAAARRLKVRRWHLSITHGRTHAAAVAVAER